MRSAFAGWLASRSSLAGNVSEGWTTDMFVEVIYNELAANRKKGGQ